MCRAACFHSFVAHFCSGSLLPFYTFSAPAIMTASLTSQLAQTLQQYLDQLHYGAHPPQLYEPISYIMSLGGKRMRPLLVLLAYRLYKVDHEAALPVAAATEVFHNFTLMHDDIMDKAPLRRNLPTVHTRWNDNVAILSGDVMLVAAYKLLMQAPDACLRPLLDLFNETAAGVCEGQQLDMNFENQQDVGVGEYLEMIRLKTAVLPAFALQAGGLLGGASAEDQQRLYAVGLHMGLGFQLIDDVLDVFGQPDKVGKMPGGDIVANKKTFLLINALQRANRDQLRQLLPLLNGNTLPAEEKVAQVKAIYEDLGIEQLARAEADHHFAQAFQQLDQIQGQRAAKEALKDLLQQMVVRQN